MPRHCALCGRFISSTPENHRFCTKAHRDKWHHTHHPHADNPRVLREATCPECGDPFSTIHHHQVYCTRKCGRRVLDRERYHTDKLTHPERAEANRVRRIENGRAWREEMREEGKCSRCGGYVPDEHSTCPECSTKTGCPGPMEVG